MSGRPEMSPYRRVVKGLGASSIGQAATVLSRLLEVPLLIAFWGVEGYGYWLILNVIPTLLTASDMGLGTVAARVMARQVGEQRYEDARETLRAAFWISTLMSAVLGAFTLAGLAFAPARVWLGVGSVEPTLVLYVTLLLSLRTIVQLDARVLQAGLTCVGRYPRAILYTGVTNLGSLLCFYAVLALGCDMVVGALSQLIASIVGYVVMHRSMLRHAPWLALGRPAIDRAALGEMWRPSLASCVISLSRSMNYSVPRLIVGAFVGPAAVAIFSAHRQLARFINFMLLFSGPFQAELSLIGRGDGVFATFARRIVQVFVWVAIGSALVVVIAGVFFFDHWVHGKFPLMPVLFAILISTTFLETVGSVVLLPAFSLNAQTQVVRVFIFANMLALLAAIPVCYAFGMNGMALMLLLIDACVCFAACRLYARLIGGRTFDAIVDAFRPPLWMIHSTMGSLRS